MKPADANPIQETELTNCGAPRKHEGEGPRVAQPLMLKKVIGRSDKALKLEELQGLWAHVGFVRTISRSQRRYWFLLISGVFENLENIVRFGIRILGNG